MIENQKRIVIKIGSSLLVDPKSERIHQQWLESLLDDISKLHAKGCEIIMVSSGAVALGKGHFQFPTPRLPLQLAQAAAAVGQVKLVHAYEREFARHGIQIAQILLSLSDSENRKRFLNASNTIESLLKQGIIPIINENDTVATTEIRYGDNDRLAARVAQMARANLLILLSDVDGLYTGDPNLVSDAEFISRVDDIDESIEALAGESASDYGSGGMKTKIDAAKIVVASGCHMCIVKGKPNNPLQKLEEGAKHTWFEAKSNPESARKNWIRQHLAPLGILTIDEGAKKALTQGTSLLPVGVTFVKGRFEKGDAVLVVDKDGVELGKGLINYSSTEAQLIAGKKSEEIESILGFQGDEEIIHRNELCLGAKWKS